jgi:hypothetical protein
MPKNYPRIEAFTFSKITGNWTEQGNLQFPISYDILNVDISKEQKIEYLKKWESDPTHEKTCVLTLSPKNLDKVSISLDKNPTILQQSMDSWRSFCAKKWIKEILETSEIQTTNLDVILEEFEFYDKKKKEERKIQEQLEENKRKELLLKDEERSKELTRQEKEIYEEKLQRKEEIRNKQQQWVKEHGSERLQKIYELGFEESSLKVYEDERLDFEYPEWDWYTDYDATNQKEIRNPKLEDLLEFEKYKNDPNLDLLELYWHKKEKCAFLMATFLSISEENNGTTSRAVIIRYLKHPENTNQDNESIDEYLEGCL